MAKTKKKGNPIIFGLALLGVSIGVIWKNEHRFDYYKAAKATEAVASVDPLTPDHLFSHTGKMDQSLTLKGHYVKSFQGFLKVRRSAKIYAWDRDEDEDGVSWSKRWMTYLQNNERNQGLTKKLKSDLIHPETYQLNELLIEQKDLQFVDSNEEIPASSLELTPRGTRQNLTLSDRFFYRSNGGQLGDEKLGDERLSYHGLPVPETATYFGKWGRHRAVAHQAEVKEGFISSIIGDKGILHHLVAGERQTALVSIKAHLSRMKNITRGIGLTTASIGGGILFSSLTRFLVFIPWIGSLINQISGWLGMLIGFLLGIITLALAFFTSKPLVLALLVLLLTVGYFILWKNATRKRKLIYQKLTLILGYAPSQNELEELQFIKLWQLLASDGKLTKGEKQQLTKLSKRLRWSSKKVAKLTQRAKEELSQTHPQENLESLIRFSLADGRIDRSEIKSLEQAAEKIGVLKPRLSILIAQIQSD